LQLGAAKNESAPFIKTQLMKYCWKSPMSVTKTTNLIKNDFCVFVKGADSFLAVSSCKIYSFSYNLPLLS